MLNLFKSVATIAIATMMVSCGGLKTDEVVLEQVIKIPAQNIDLKVADYNDEDGEIFGIESMITIECLKDFEDFEQFGTRIYMILLDADGVELTKIFDSELPTKAGQKKKCQLGMSWLERLTKEQCNDIIKQTKSVRFEGEGLDWLTNENTILNIMQDVIEENIECAEEIIDDFSDKVNQICEEIEDIYEEDLFEEEDF